MFFGTQQGWRSSGRHDHDYPYSGVNIMLWARQCSSLTSVFRPSPCPDFYIRHLATMPFADFCLVNQSSYLDWRLDYSIRLAVYSYCEFMDSTCIHQGFDMWCYLTRIPKLRDYMLFLFPSLRSGQALAHRFALQLPSDNTSRFRPCFRLILVPILL